MNELIEKLLDEAELDIVWDQDNPDYKWVEGSEESLLKFAELIVRECVDVIVRNEHATLNIDNFTNEKAQGIQLGLEFATIDIAEHFGIEE